MTTADSARVLEINRAEVPAVGEVTADELAHLVDQSSMSLVVESGVDARHEVVGFCIVMAPGAAYHSVNYRWFSDRYDDFIYLDRVAISPRFQGAGLGRRLYAEVERLGATRFPTATHFLLEVNLRPRNDASLAFHERLGFAEVGQQETPKGALVSMLAKPLGGEPVGGHRRD